MMKACLILFCFFLLSALSPLKADSVGTLTDNLKINSTFLGYDLQYRVFLPTGPVPENGYPTLYVTDGQWYLRFMEFEETLRAELAKGRIHPIIVVFVDSRNPDDLTDIRRTDEFICNEEYAKFFKGELVPTIEHNFPANQNRKGRTILGLSFGGINAGCFGLMLSDVFSGIAVQSPGNHHHIAFLRKQYLGIDKLPLKVFLSVGTKKDNWQATRKFKHVLDRKGYDLTYKEVPFDHDWPNWKSLVDDTLEAFYAKTVVSK